MNRRLVLPIVLLFAFVLNACAAQPTQPPAATQAPVATQPQAATQVPAEPTKTAEPAKVTAPAKFVFSTWGDATFYQDCFKRFQGKYPEYASTTFENVQADSDSTLQQRLMTDFAANSFDTIPDMVEMSASRIPELADAGILVDLSANMAPFKDKISPGVWQGITRNGKVYAVPWMANSAMVWYRDDVFKEAGIDVSKIETWDDYIAAGKQITQFKFKDGKKHYMLSLGTTDVATQTMQLMLGEQDTGLFDMTTGDTLIDKDAKFQNAFATVDRFAKEGIALRIAEWEAPWFAALGDGTIASYISANWMDQIIKGGDLGGDQSGKWRAMMLPAFQKGGNRGALESNSANVVILNKPYAKTDMAFKMAQTCFMSDDITASLTKDHNLVPAYLPALDDARFSAPDPFYGGQEIGKLDKAVQQIAKPFPYTAAYSQAMELINEQLALVVDGKISVDQGITDAASAIRSKIGTSK
jgi:ABC-type glycerol-3-phosphate transport system substrate-binding protein